MSAMKQEGPFRIPLPPIPGETESRMILLTLPRRLLASDRFWFERFLDALYWDPDPAETPKPVEVDPLTPEAQP